MSDALRFRDGFAAMALALGASEDELQAMLPSEIAPPRWTNDVGRLSREGRAARLAPELARLVLSLGETRLT